MNGTRLGDGFLATVERSSRVAEFVAVLLLFGFGGLMLAEVFARGFLSASLPYSWEYSTYAMAGVFFLGLGGALRNGTHVRVSLLLEHGSSPVFVRRVDLVATLVGLILAVLVADACLTLVQNSFARGLRAASVTATPLAVPQTLALLGAVQLVLELLARALRLLRGDPTVREDASTDTLPDVSTHELSFTDGTRPGHGRA